MGLNKSVDFSTAKLLKEKGFPQPKSLQESKEFGLLFDWYNEDGVYNANYKLDTIIQAPTIAEVVMWLYETHGIWISISMENNEEDNVSFYYSITENINDETYFRIRKSNFKSPTEAYEAAIEYTLNNLL